MDNKLDLTNIKNAVATLKEAINYYNTDVEQPIKNIFRYTQGYGLIQDWTKWVEYNDARNNTSQECNLNKAQFVLTVLQTFLEDVKSFINCLKQSINENN